MGQISKSNPAIIWGFTVMNRIKHTSQLRWNYGMENFNKQIIQETAKYEHILRF